MKQLREHIDKAGILGVIFSHLYCIGLGAQVSLGASAISGLLTSHNLLTPFLFVSLGVSILGVFFSYLRHNNIVPFLISVVSAAIILVFSFFVHIEILLYVGLAGLIGASVYNMSYSKKCAC